MNVYLYEKNLTALQTQKNMREMELLIQECILITIRESIPTEDIIRAYMDENVEQEEEVFVEQVKEPVLEKASDSEMNTQEEKEEEDDKVDIPITPSIKNMDEEKVVTRLSFNNNDSVLDENDTVQDVDAPKTLERLEEISSSRALERMLAENDDNDNEDERLTISTEDIDLTGFSVLDAPNNVRSEDNEIKLDIEELL
jgi:hypothetical protein